MLMVYKLGEGPFNYDWNIRYIKTVGSDLYYSPYENEKDMKVINIEGAPVSSICKIKEKNYSLCITLPPPLNKSIFLATDTLQECNALREKIIKATMNEHQTENYHTDLDEQINNFNFDKIKNLKDDVVSVGLSKINKFNKFYSDEFFKKLEFLKNEIVSLNFRYKGRYINDLKKYVPVIYYGKFFKNILKILIGVLISVFIIIFSFSFSYFLNAIFILLGYLLFKRSKSNLLQKLKILIFELNNDNCDYNVEAYAIISCDYKKIFETLSNYKLLHVWDNFISCDKHLQELPDDNLKIRYTVPDEIISRYPLLEIFSDELSNEYFIDSLTYIDEKDNYFITYTQKHEINPLFETFILIPIKENELNPKTLVIFLTNFHLKTNLPYFINQAIKEERLNILSNLKHMLTFNEYNLNNLYAISQILPKIERKESLWMQQFDEEMKVTEEELLTISEEMETARSFNDTHLYDVNPKSILTYGKRLPLELRFPGYIRNPEGGVECRNTQELRCQEGIILEVMKRAGQQLLEGKNVVAISLPVRIFEPQSTVTRITEVWGAGPNLINKAAAVRSPVERMKYVISYAIAGLHMNIKQLKPFNPILGETYEGYWPDGTKIYIEHMSHHPPISRFLLISQSNWKIYGYYEYIAKLKGFTGNVIGGCFKGPNCIDFGNDDVITYNLPSMNISGLMYGRRIMEWEGRMEFLDKKNNIKAFLNFTPPPSFFKKFIEPTDIFRGELLVDDIVVHSIEGSPIRSIKFDNEIYWELETTDIYKPVAFHKSLPSDCRFRTDLIALAQGDVAKADEEKVRLEVIQRADRALRQKNKK